MSKGKKQWTRRQCRQWSNGPLPICVISYKVFWFANFYQQFILPFAQIALPITNLLKAKGSDKAKATPELGHGMPSGIPKAKEIEPVLKHSHSEKPFVIQADTSNVAVRVILFQENK